MLRFTDPSSTPPGGKYPYTQPETNQYLEALNLQKLGQLVKAHRIANDIPIGINFDRELEHGCCKKILELYPTFTGVEEDNGQRIKQSWNLGDVVSWASTMVDWAKKGFKFVSKEHANNRAEICAGCPKNIDIEGCAGCAGVTKLIPLIRGNQTTAYDEQLRVCGACGCVLKAVVVLPIDVLAKSHSKDLPYWQNCWLPSELDGLEK